MAPLRTLRGTPIRRYRNLVGKLVGSQLYVHRNYAHLVVPRNLERGLAVLRRNHPGFRFNSIMVDSKTKVIRFDEAPDFDTAREPHVGRYVKVYSTGASETGYSNSIWHHKWLWVMDDYKGFDVEESKRWSARWLRIIPETAKGTDRTWEAQLRRYTPQKPG